MVATCGSLFVLAEKRRSSVIADVVEVMHGNFLYFCPLCMHGRNYNVGPAVLRVDIQIRYEEGTKRV